MTDQYLCRGKRLDGDHEWVEGCYVFAERHDRNGLEHFILEVSADGAQYEVDPATVGRCTGLRDINGKLIFEGDICIFVDFSGGSDHEMPCEGVFAFCDGQFFVTNRLSAEMDDLIVNGSFDGTICGNVHDNHELLGGGQDGD